MDVVTTRICMGHMVWTFIFAFCGVINICVPEELNIRDPKTNHNAQRQIAEVATWVKIVLYNVVYNQLSELISHERYYKNHDDCPCAFIKRSRNQSYIISVVDYINMTSNDNGI